METHASVQEIVWTIAGGVGVVLRLRALGQAIEDRRWAAEHAGEDATVTTVAGASVRNESVGLTVKLIVVVIGIAAMLTPANPDPSTPLYQAVIGSLLIGVIILLDVNSALGSRDRSRIISIEKRKRGLEGADDGA